jgi:hypothetical protein
MRSENKIFSIRMNPRELAALNRLAKTTGRTKAATVRRLLAMADQPDARRWLGEPIKSEVQNGRC